MSWSSRARSASVTRGIKSRTAITSSASRTWYASISSCGVSDRTSARRRGRIVISPSAARRPMASLMGPRLIASSLDSATSDSSVPGRR